MSLQILHNKSYFVRFEAKMTEWAGELKYEDKAERTRLVQPGKEKTAGRPHHSPPVMKGSL